MLEPGDLVGLPLIISTARPYESRAMTGEQEIIQVYLILSLNIINTVPLCDFHEGTFDITAFYKDLHKLPRLELSIQPTVFSNLEPIA